MTLDEYATMLEASLRQLAVHRQPWVRPEDNAALVRTMKRQVSDADRVLQRPSTPETDAARGKLYARRWRNRIGLGVSVVAGAGLTVTIDTYFPGNTLIAQLPFIAGTAGAVTFSERADRVTRILKNRKEERASLLSQNPQTPTEILPDNPTTVPPYK